MSNFISETDVLKAGDLIEIYDIFLGQKLFESRAVVLNAKIDTKMFETLTIITLDNLDIFVVYDSHYKFDMLKCYTLKREKGHILIYIKRILKLEEII